MENSKRVEFLGVQRKKKNKSNQRNKKTSVFKNVVNYLNSDSYMFAPLINNSPSKHNSASATAGVEVKDPPIKGNNKILLRRLVDYLKSSDSYMYASLCAPQPITPQSIGTIWYVKRVTMEISTRTLTMEDNHPSVQSTNMIAEDQVMEGSLPKTGISTPHSLFNWEVVKNMGYGNCRSSSVSGARLTDKKAPG